MHCVCVFRPGLYRMQCAWRGRGAARCVVGRLPVSRVVCTLQAKKVDAKMKLWCTVADSVRLIVEGTSALRPFVAHQRTLRGLPTQGGQSAAPLARAVSVGASERVSARVLDGACVRTCCRRSAADGVQKRRRSSTIACRTRGCCTWREVGLPRVTRLSIPEQSRARFVSTLAYPRDLALRTLRAPSLRQPRSAQTATVEAPACAE